MAPQAIEQRLHLVRQLGHIGESEGSRSTFDGMGATEYAVELLVVGLLQIQIEQHLLHLVQILGRLLKEDLVKL